MTDETNGEGAAPAEDATLAATAEDGSTPAEDAGANPDADAPGAEPPPAKPKQTAQQRIDELTWRVREAERREAALLDRIGKPAAEEKPVDAPKAEAEPNPEDYEHGEFDRGFIKDLTRYEARQAHLEITSRATAQTTQAQAVQSFESRVKELFPDGEPAGLVAIRELDELPIALQQIMLESDVGPKLADHYGANPAELARLSSMTPTQQAREIARIEFSLPAKAAPVPAKTATDAPEPPPSARGSGGKFLVAGDTDDFAAFQKRAETILGA